MSPLNERHTRWTPSGVRLRQVSAVPGPWNWLFVPGGPGVGSDSLLELVDAVRVPGSTWLVDLPGEGSNRAPAGAPADPYSLWPHVLVEAVQALDNVVLVAHSTGGMFALSVSELEQHLAGLVLIGSAPHAGWRPVFAEYVGRHPLPAVDAAAAEYAERQDDSSLRLLTIAAAPWNFTDAGVRAGEEIFANLPYNHAATAWADAHFDEFYTARWSPRTIPTLIMAGAEDHIVTRSLWRDAEAFQGPNVAHRVVADAGHWPWVENPERVRALFVEFIGRLTSGPTPAR